MAIVMYEPLTRECRCCLCGNGWPDAAYFHRCDDCGKVFCDDCDRQADDPECANEFCVDCLTK